MHLAVIDYGAILFTNAKEMHERSEHGPEYALAYQLIIDSLTSDDMTNR